MVGNFRTYIRRYTSPNERFEYGYPHSKALHVVKFSFKKTVKIVHIAITSSGCQFVYTHLTKKMQTVQFLKCNFLNIND